MLLEFSVCKYSSGGRAYTLVLCLRIDFKDFSVLRLWWLFATLDSVGIDLTLVKVLLEDKLDPEVGLFPFLFELSCRTWKFCLLPVPCEVVLLDELEKID